MRRVVPRATEGAWRGAGVEQLDLLGELSDQLGSFLGADLAAAQSPSKSKCATPESVTPAARKRVLSPGYFERCAAVDFAIKMNDGVNLQHLIEVLSDPPAHPSPPQGAPAPWACGALMCMGRRRAGGWR